MIHGYKVNKISIKIPLCVYMCLYVCTCTELDESILKHVYLRLPKTVIIHFSIYLLICKHSVFVTVQVLKVLKKEGEQVRGLELPEVKIYYKGIII